jgi:signal peptidase II
VTHHKRHSMAIYLATFVVLADQMSKWWVMHQIVPPPEGISVTDFLNLVIVKNRGVTFGLLSRFDPHWMSYALIGLAAMILFLLGRWLWRTSSTLVAVALGLIMGGAIGNIIDRFRFGAVVDFLDFHLAGYHWYSFNLADSAIVTGVGLLFLDGLIRGR